MKRILTVLSQKWPEYLIEAIVIIASILGAYALDNWNEQNKNREKLTSSMIALRRDLVQDTILIHKSLPEVKTQYQLNESLRARIAMPSATTDTLINIIRHEFNPDWTSPVVYNTNAYNSLIETTLIEDLNDTIKGQIKDFYNQKNFLLTEVERITGDYREKLITYVDTYTFGATALHDQGPLIDSLVWSKVDYSHVAASFQGLSNFKRLLFNLTEGEMNYSLEQSKMLIQSIDQFIEESGKY